MKASEETLERKGPSKRSGSTTRLFRDMDGGRGAIVEVRM